MNIIEGNNKLDSLFLKNFTSRAVKGYVEIGKQKFCQPITYRNYEERIRKFEVRTDDVFLATFPKTGSTWANEMIWLITNNLDYDSATETIQMRAPLLEFSSLLNRDEMTDMYKESSMTYADNLKSPRCLKTHFAFPLLPEQITNGTKKPKIIVTVRNPQDVCVSAFHFQTKMERYKGSFEEFCECFLGGRVQFGPFWDHVLSYWQNRHNLNILFIHFKDMKKNISEVIKKVANFLEKPITEEEVQLLTTHLSFKNMRDNPAVNHGHMVKKYTENNTEENTTLVRSGKEGGYKNVMTPEILEKFETQTKIKTSGTGLKF